MNAKFWKKRLNIGKGDKKSVGPLMEVLLWSNGACFLKSSKNKALSLVIVEGVIVVAEDRLRKEINCLKIENLDTSDFKS